MELNKKTVKRIQGLVLFSILVFFIVQNHKVVIDWIYTGIKLATPFIIGGCIAFILNVPMRAIEIYIFKCKDSDKKAVKKLKRIVSLLISIFTIVGVIMIVIFVVAPELANTIISIGETIPLFVKEIQVWAEEMLKQYPELVDQITALKFDWESIIKNILEFLGYGAGSILNSTVTIAAGFISVVVSFVFSFIFAIYILIQKERLSQQLKRLLYAYLDEKRVEKILYVATVTEKTFSNFLAGQCLEASILGCMFFITLTIFKFPYALLIGVLVAFTALIPIIGAFVGCIIGALLILMISPIKAIVFVIIFLILQQIEQSLIYPHVVGSSVGLPSIWVLAAVILGGNLMGVFGMLVFIPLVSVAYTFLRAEVNRRLREKHINKEKVLQSIDVSEVMEEDSDELEEDANEVEEDATL